MEPMTAPAVAGTSAGCAAQTCAAGSSGSVAGSAGGAPSAGMASRAGTGGTAMAMAGAAAGEPATAPMQTAGMPAAPPADAKPGAAGIGDAYFPESGNGGYDVGHYAIKLRYTPSEDRLAGTTTLTLTPSAPLSRFNLDFLLDVSEVAIDGVAAKFAREGQH